MKKEEEEEKAGKERMGKEGMEGQTWTAGIRMRIESSGLASGIWLQGIEGYGIKGAVLEMQAGQAHIPVLFFV